MNILEGLNHEQELAVTTTEGPVLVIAGAGSGKTKVLTQRIAYILSQKPDVKPWNILAITFTNKAANEMKERIEMVIGNDANSIWTGTFHSICTRILRKHIDKIGFTSSFNIYDTTDTKTIIKECLRELNIDSKIFSEKKVQGSISKAKSEMIDEKKYEINAGNDYWESKVAQIYSLYQKKLKQNNGLDFDDIILCTIKILLDNPEVLAYYQQKFRYIMVDEYQDTNKPQFTLINLLSGMYGNLFVVGDNDQSIYAFRGADISNILNFEKDYPGAKIIKLEQNYRSTQYILDVANDIIKNNQAKIQKNLWTDKKEGAKPIYANVKDQYAEGQYIADCINKEVRSGRKYSDCAILYRTNAQSRAIEDIFLKERIPYKVIGGMKFYDRKEIKDIIAYLRVIENPADSVSLRRIINEPKRGIGDTTVNKILDIAVESNTTMFNIIEQADIYTLKGTSVLKNFAQMINDFRQEKDNMSIEKLIDWVLDMSGYKQMLEAEDTVEAQSRLENIEELKTIAMEFSSESAENNLGMFLESISLVSDIDNLDEEQDYVVLMTMHNAKGLEFPVVFVCGLEEGLFPSNQSMLEENGVEEERRLCYVAVTRAKTNLHLISAKIRTIYGNTSCAIPSRFLKEISPNLIEYIDDTIKKVEMLSNDQLSKITNKVNNVFKTPEVFLNSLNNSNSQMEDVDLSKFKPGVNVNHRKFGKGTIISVEPDEDDLKVEINFETFGTKRLMAKFARLEILK